MKLVRIGAIIGFIGAILGIILYLIVAIGGGVASSKINLPGLSALGTTVSVVVGIIAIIIYAIFAYFLWRVWKGKSSKITDWVMAILLIILGWSSIIACIGGIIMIIGLLMSMGKSEDLSSNKPDTSKPAE